DVDAEQPELAALEDEVAIERPVLLLEAFIQRIHLALDELAGGLANEPVLVGDLLGRHHVTRTRLLDQPRPTLYRHAARYARHDRLPPSLFRTAPQASARQAIPKVGLGVSVSLWPRTSGLL